MFYKVAFSFIKGIFYILNGKIKVENKEKLPEGNYILAAPHKTWWDPLVLAIACLPKQFTFMAKKELFKNKFFSWVLDKVNVFPVDRKNPGPSAIKLPVQRLKKTDLSLMIFPSGTRHSEELKGGIALIAKMSRVPIVPAVYEGPLTIKDILLRHKMTIRFGDPIDTKTVTTDEAGREQLMEQLNEAFSELHKEK